MNPLILSEHPSIFNQYLAEMRDVDIQRDPMRFRANMQRVGAIMAYELSRWLPAIEQEVTTPLGSASHMVPEQDPVLAVILRAALPFHQGFQQMFDQADSAFISAYRKHPNGGDLFEIVVEYVSTPSLEGRTLVLLDPMLASGRSMVSCYDGLVGVGGKPAAVVVCSVIASEQGIDYVKKHLPDARLLIGAVDSEMTARGYIVPGLGDAGDLSYGEKCH